MSQSQSFSIVLDGVKYGAVSEVGGQRRYVVKRKPENLYRSCPCREHGRCEGFTVSKEAVDRAEAMGAVTVQVNYEDGLMSAVYVAHIEVVKDAATTLDNRDKLQYSLPLHRWTKMEE